MTFDTTVHEPGVHRDRSLDHLGESLLHLRARKSLQEGRVCPYPTWVMERPHQVLACGKIVSGLAAKGCIDHGQQQNWPERALGQGGPAGTQREWRTATIGGP